MAVDRMTVRLDPNLKADIEREAKIRGQTEGSLVRTFVREGLAGYDATNVRTYELVEIAEERIRRLETMVGTIIHLLVEQQVLSLPAQEDEVHEAYAARLKGLYADKVRVASERGSRIKGVVETPPN